MRLKLVAAALLLAGCAASSIPQEVRAVRDFVALAELERVDIIRLYRQLEYSYVNDYFVTVSIWDRHYLVEFDSRCRALLSNVFTAAMVDHRHDPSYLRKADTIRGCPVGKIYEVTAEQIVEIKNISEAQATGAVVPSDA